MTTTTPTARSERIIIVGAGNAGLPAAIEAADRGAQVVLIEKQSDIGGMLHVSGGWFSGAGARRQRAAGVEDSPERHHEEVQRIGYGKGNDDLIRLSVGLQGEMVDWLETFNFDFDSDGPQFFFGHELYETPRTYHGRNGGRSLLATFRRELNRRVEEGKIDLRLSTRVKQLVQNEQGVVTGVVAVAVGPDGQDQGEPYTIEGSAVVLCTGGYLANRELSRQFLKPDWQAALTACLAHATGDGLVMARELGAAETSYGHFLPTMGLVPDPDRPGFSMGWLELRVNMVRQKQQPADIWVNNRGERFVAEDVHSPEERERALLAQPDLRMAVIWDQRALDEGPQLLVPADKWPRERVMEEARRGKWLKQAETLEELAQLLQIDPAGLVRTVERYNEGVAKQQDPDFGRKSLPFPIAHPPYYGIICQGGQLTSREGLRIDTECRVLDQAGQPIPGLYAVGEVLGASQFMGANTASGMAVGPAIALGRFVGRRLAEQARR